MKRRVLTACLISLTLLTQLSSSGARAQASAPDPQPVLSTLIEAFQRCGPPQSYLLLGAAVYQTIWAQTGGLGCYQQIAAFGPVQSMTILNSVPYPAGPIYTIRTDHPAGPLFWQIGISQFTQKVEHLTVNFTQPPPPPQPPQAAFSPISPTRPDIPGEKPRRQTEPVISDEPRRRVDPQEACLIYEGMCPPSSRRER